MGIDYGAPGNANGAEDITGLRVGHAEDADVRSGVTVLLSDAPLLAAVDVRGGGPGTRETDALRLEGTVDHAHAIVLAGGSAFGLAAASPVQSALADRGVGFAVGDARVPIVPAAIIFDLMNGGAKPAMLHRVYDDLGACALANAACPPAPEGVKKPISTSARVCSVVGSVGAGFGATTALYKGGLGTASALRSDGLSVAAIAVVNAFGCVTVPGTPHFWAAPFEQVHNGAPEFGDHGPWQGGAGTLPAPAMKRGPQGKAASHSVPPQNTTLGIIATNAAVSARALRRIATMGQAGLARAIAPVHCPLDGDTVFAVSTCALEIEDDPALIAVIGEMAARTMARAIARGVFAARTGWPEWSTPPAFRDRWG